MDCAWTIVLPKSTMKRVIFAAEGEGLFLNRRGIYLSHSSLWDNTFIRFK